MLDALWERSPALAFALLGPLVAVSLYQTSPPTAELEALELARDRLLTGLGNYRDFHERLEQSLDIADDTQVPS